MRPRFLIFIPGYNCAPQIPRVLEGVRKSCYDLVDEIIFMDNQSKDGTLDAAAKARAEYGMDKLTLIQNKANYGLGGSHKVAFRYAFEKAYDYLIILHGDNQADPAEVPLFIEKALKNPSLDAVLGDRFSSLSRRIGYSKLRTFGNVGINWIYSAVALHHVRDMGAGLNLVKMSTLKNLDYESCSDFCDFHTQLLLDMLEAKWNLHYLPISWREEDQKSNINPFIYGLKTLKILFDWRFHRSRNSQAAVTRREFSILPTTS